MNISPVFCFSSEVPDQHHSDPNTTTEKSPEPVSEEPIEPVVGTRIFGSETQNDDHLKTATANSSVEDHTEKKFGGNSSEDVGTTTTPKPATGNASTEDHTDRKSGDNTSTTEETGKRKKTVNSTAEWDDSDSITEANANLNSSSKSRLQSLKNGATSVTLSVVNLVNVAVVVAVTAFNLV